MGRPRKKLTEEKAYEAKSIETLKCLHCGRVLGIKEFYESTSVFYKDSGKLPYCKECIEEIYNIILDKYKKLGYINPERKSIERICMAFDIYYDDKVFDIASKDEKLKSNGFIMSMYMKNVNLSQLNSRKFTIFLDILPR